MISIKELDDFKATFIDVKMDVPLLKIWGVRLPSDCFGKSSLNGTPSLKAQAAAVLGDL